MGSLHEGHLRLIDDARRRCGYVVTSIFVNPLQFAPGEDLARYPRDEAGDIARAAGRGSDLVFLPTVAVMYPEPRSVAVVPHALGQRWEGTARPGHFTGVLTVVAKLFNIVGPDIAVFGQKDIQQATLVRAMVHDLDIPVQVIVAPTVRAANGVALSSRNAYLDAGDRTRAAVIKRALDAVGAAYAAGERSGAVLERVGAREVSAESRVQLEYLAVVDPDRLEPAALAVAGSLVIVAARVGGTRLIDNVILGGSTAAGTGDHHGLPQEGDTGR